MVNSDGYPVRLVEEFFYKPIFVIDKANMIGYELFKLQHKNDLINKLQRAFRRLVTLCIEQEFENMANIEQLDKISIQSEHNQPFKEKLDRRIIKYKLKKQRVELINIFKKENDTEPTLFRNRSHLKLRDQHD